MNKNSVDTSALEAVYASIDEFNSLQPPEQQLEKKLDEVLLGANGKLNSLGLVSFLVTVEERASTEFAKPLTLASEKAFSLRSSPFATVGSLAAYIAELLEEDASV